MFHTAGTWSVTATDAITTMITGSQTGIVVPQGQPAVSVTSSTMGTSSFGQSVTFTATVTGVSGTAPTGSVQFSYTPMGSMTSTPIGIPVTLDMTGKATVGTSALPLGTNQTITASYSGDGNFATSSGTVTQTVSKATSTVGVTSSSTGTPPTSTFGRSVTFTATVTGVNGTVPTGRVQFSYTPMGGMMSTQIGTPVMLDMTGKATVSTSALPVGTDTITATYSGDGNYLMSSGTVSQSVGKATSTTAVTSSTNPSIGGVPVTFTATVSGIAGSTPGGTVQFTATPTGSMTRTPIGTPVTLDGTGKASVMTSTLPVGWYTIAATYSGDENYTAGSPGGVTQTVSAATVTALTVTAPTGAGSGNSGNASSPTLNLGGRMTLTATGTYSNGTTGSVSGLTATSSNPGVASVDAAPGIVTANTGGQTVITVTALNGTRTQITVTVPSAAGTGLMPAPQPMTHADAPAAVAATPAAQPPAHPAGTGSGAGGVPPQAGGVPTATPLPQPSRH